MTMKKPLIGFVGDDGNAASVFAQIRETLGDEDAEELAMYVGGQRIALPRPSKLCPEHLLCQRIGYELACRIVEAVSPEEGGVSAFYVPSLIELRVIRLLEEDGLTAREIAQRAGVCMRTVHRYRARMLKKGLRVGNHKAPRTLYRTYEISKGEKIVRTLLLEGHSPSQVRDILAVPGEVVLTIRAELLKEGKLQ